MAPIDSSRRALTNLPVNTSAIHHPAILVKENSASLKRLIHDVEDPEIQSAATRPRTYLRKNLLDSSKKQITEDISAFSAIISPLKAINRPRLEIVDLEEMGGSSQNSSKDSISTITDFDMGNETTASQETAQTDITQPVESAAYLYAETLRLRLRVALFKVQTNQTNIPMSQLEISSINAHRTHETLPISPLLQSNATGSKLLPAPILKSTAYSTHMTSQEQFPSSPPHSHSNSPAIIRHANIFETPKILQQKQQGLAQQLSSPPDSLHAAVC